MNDIFYMVTPPELGLQLISWIALFIPALAITLNAVTRLFEENEVLQMFGIAGPRKNEAYMISTIIFGAVFVGCVALFAYLSMSLNLPLFKWPEGLLMISIFLILFALLLTLLLLFQAYRANRVGLRSVPEALEDQWDEHPESVLFLTHELLKNRQLSGAEAVYIVSSVSGQDSETVEQVLRGQEINESEG